MVKCKLKSNASPHIAISSKSSLSHTPCTVAEGFLSRKYSPLLQLEVNVCSQLICAMPRVQSVFCPDWVFAKDLAHRRPVPFRGCSVPREIFFRLQRGRESANFFPQVPRYSNLLGKGCLRHAASTAYSLCTEV